MVSMKAFSGLAGRFVSSTDARAANPNKPSPTNDPVVLFLLDELRGYADSRESVGN
jgi:hypothetical protein